MPSCVVPQCRATRTQQWCTGPNGPRTLCFRCYARYSSYRLPVFLTEENTLSVICTSNAKPVRITGFARRAAGTHQRDIARPFYLLTTAPPGAKPVAAHPDYPPSLGPAHAVAPPQNPAPPPTFMRPPPLPVTRPPLRSCLRAECSRVCYKLFTGPDGQATLCGACYRHYISRRLLLFQHQPSGRLSILWRPGLKVVKVVAWPECIPARDGALQPSQSSLIHPKVIPATQVDVWKWKLTSGWLGPWPKEKQLPDDTKPLPASAVEDDRDLNLVQPKTRAPRRGRESDALFPSQLSVPEPPLSPGLAAPRPAHGLRQATPPRNHLEFSKPRASPIAPPPGLRRPVQLCFSRPLTVASARAEAELFEQLSAMPDDASEKADQTDASPAPLAGPSHRQAQAWNDQGSRKRRCSDPEWTPGSEERRAQDGVYDNFARKKRKSFVEYGGVAATSRKQKLEDCLYDESDDEDESVTKAESDFTEDDASPMRSRWRRSRWRRHYPHPRSVCMRPGCGVRPGLRLSTERAGSRDSVAERRYLGRNWRTGPDGLKTLCKDCSRNYAKGKFLLYKDPQTNQVSITEHPGWIRSKLVGFWQSRKMTNDLLRPEVRALGPHEVLRFHRRRRRTRQLSVKLDEAPTIQDERKARDELEHSIKKELEGPQLSDGDKAHLTTHSPMAPKAKYTRESSRAFTRANSRWKQSHQERRQSWLAEVDAFGQTEPSSPLSSTEREIASGTRV